MKNFIDFHNKIEHFLNSSWKKMACLYHQYKSSSPFSFLHFLLFFVNPFWIQLSYFILLSLFGFVALKASKPENTASRPNDINLFFTSVSSATVSSMSAVEMEVFSNTQLVIITFLMFFGGEVFTSMLELQVMKFKFTRKDRTKNRVQTFDKDFVLELDEMSNNKQLENEKLDIEEGKETNSMEDENFRFNCIKTLALVIFCYLFVIHFLGSSLITIYMSIIPSARMVLKEKGLNLQIFSIFTTVSTFANCGFVPTNENMMVFKKNPGLLLILIPQVLLGNTLYPVCLNLIIWFFSWIKKDSKFSYMLKNPRILRYGHLFSGFRSIFLAITVFGFIVVQFVLFCSLEWHSEATGGLSFYEKLVASLFQVVNSRHTGETVFDLSLMTPAFLVVYVLMMYFPPYTSLQPFEDEDNKVIREKKKRIQRKDFMEYIFFSPLSNLVIFITLICITEREKMKKDPLNFNVLNIVFEVISAYGNVGSSIGYSCAKQMNPDGHCKDAWYGFAGRWSNKGKFILIIVMFFGRLKKFSMKGGKAWKLS